MEDKKGRWNILKKKYVHKELGIQLIRNLFTKHEKKKGKKKKLNTILKSFQPAIRKNDSSKPWEKKDMMLSKQNRGHNLNVELLGYEPKSTKDSSPN